MTERPSRRQLDESTDAVLVASRALVAIAAQSMPDADDVTLPQYRALVVLAGRGAITSGTLSELLDVHPSTTTRLVDRLEAKGLVTRSSTGDRREVVVGLRPAGIRLLDEVTKRRRAGIRAALRRLPADRVEVLLASFQEFGDAAGELPDNRWSAVLQPPAFGPD